MAQETARRVIRLRSVDTMLHSHSLGFFFDVRFMARLTLSFPPAVTCKHYRDVLVHFLLTFLYLTPFVTHPIIVRSF